MGEWGGGGVWPVEPWYKYGRKDRYGGRFGVAVLSFPREPVVGGVRLAVCLATPAAAAWVGTEGPG